MTVLVLACLVIGTGIYLKWFGFSSKEGEDKTNYSVTVDKEKIKADVEQAKEKLKELPGKLKEKTGSGATAKEEPKDSRPAATDEAEGQ